MLGMDGLAGAGQVPPGVVAVVRLRAFGAGVVAAGDRIRHELEKVDVGDQSLRREQQRA